MPCPDAVVVGSGPNGLAAAIVIAQSGRKVAVFEAEPVIGGGTRSAALTLPGFVHDVCSAIHPFGRASPFFRTLPLDTYGLEWIEPPAMLAHPFDDGGCAMIYRSLEQTTAGLGGDAAVYRRLIGSIVDAWPRIERSVLGPLAWPKHPIAFARFGVNALRPAAGLSRSAFSGDRTRALLAGIAAHGMLPLDRMPTAAFGLVLAALAHIAGWVLPRGGAQRIADALAAHLRALGGELFTGTRIKSIDDLPAAKVFDQRPLQVVGGIFHGLAIVRENVANPDIDVVALRKNVGVAFRGRSALRAMSRRLMAVRHPQR